jgi:hypothetical protein
MRFNEASTAELEAVRVAPYSTAFFPFGYGGHGCIGRNLAQQAALLIFGSLVAGKSISKSSLPHAVFNSSDSEHIMGFMDAGTMRLYCTILYAVLIMGFMDAVNQEGVRVEVTARTMTHSARSSAVLLPPVPPAPVPAPAPAPAPTAAALAASGSRSGKYTREEVAMHNTADDCWFVLGSKVIDITPFINTHPGGREVLAGQGGKDATKIFKLIQHSDFAVGESEKYVVGELVGGD